ncbi:MAG: LOG family protein [Pseudomonadota bacterium]
MGTVLLSGTASEAMTAGQLTGERRHRLLRDLPDDYRFEASLEPHMQAADAYVFMPDGDPMLAMSVLVAKRIEPDVYWDKPVVFVEQDGKRHPLAELFEDLSASGVAREKPEEVFTLAQGLDGVRDVIGPIKDRAAKQEKPVAYMPVTHPPGSFDLPETGFGTKQTAPDDLIAVYCSASTEKPADLALATAVGEAIAARGWGITYGAGNVSMMGAVARAVIDKGSFVHGVTTEQVWKNNGELTEGSRSTMPMTSLELTQDIYTRMHKMFMPQPGKPVKGVMLLKGGAGSSQEMFALHQLRKAEPLFRDVPLAIINRDGEWDALVKAAQHYGMKPGQDFQVFDTVEAAMPYLDAQVAQLNAKPDWPGPDMDDAAGRLGGWRRPDPGGDRPKGTPANKRSGP